MNEKLRILVVDDDRMMAKTLVDIFSVKGLAAEAAYSGPEALEKVKKQRFDCILTDIKMPEMNGVELYRAIKEVQPDPTIVLMTAYSTDTLVAEGMKEGAVATLTKPLDVNLLLNFFDSLRKERTIAIVDGDPQFLKMLGDALRARGFVVTELADYHDIGKVLGQEKEQVVLLNLKLDDNSGLDALRVTREQYPHLPLVLATGYRDEITSALKVALKIGAYTCLYKPFKISDLLRVLTTIRKKELRRAIGQPDRTGGDEHE